MNDTRRRSRGQSMVEFALVAPLFFKGEAQFGVIMQSAIAFTHLLGAFSLVITQFPVISSYAAVLARLTALNQGTQPVKSTRGNAIQVVETDDRLAWEHLTLRNGQGGVLVDDLCVAVPPGSRHLVRGDGAASALFRATAGMWERGEGRVIRPKLDGIVFLPERSVCGLRACRSWLN